MLRRLIAPTLATVALVSFAGPVLAETRDQYVFMYSETDTEFVIELVGEQRRAWEVVHLYSGHTLVDLSGTFVLRLWRASDCTLVASYTLDAFQPWNLYIDENDEPRLMQTGDRELAEGEIPTTRCLDIPNTASEDEASPTEGSRVPLLLLGVLAAGLALAAAQHVAFRKGR